MFEQNMVKKDIGHIDFKASEVKHATDKVIKARQDEADRKEQAEFDRYRDWIIKWGISINGAKTLESIMINIQDTALNGYYSFIHDFKVGSNTYGDIKIIKDMLEDMGFNVDYEIRYGTPAKWHETIATITWEE